MNVAYFIYVGKYIEDDMFDICIRSLRKQSDCKIVVYTTHLENSELLEQRGAEIIYISDSQWTNRKMTCKVECAANLPNVLNLNEGDNILVFDADLIFLDDPFKVFETEFDFMYTTRHYYDTYKANGGVWGYKHNKVSSEFLNFYQYNLNNPAWLPYVEFRKNHQYNRDLKNLDWWVDQDWLCVINNYKDKINNDNLLQMPITLYDAGPKYNWIIRNGSDEVIKEINAKEKMILHLKGGTFTRWTDASTKTSDPIYKKYIELIT
tara:strand:+ start:1535 stop:2326 length:792 start_codon:yes stop_codon:yes gene_type:complete